MNTYIGIDASLTSTAVCITSDGYTNKYVNVTSGRTNGKWHSMLSNVEYKYVSYPKVDDYSKSEVAKHMAYRVAADVISQSIRNNVTSFGDVTICMEGYSYSSAAGPLIDLVTFGTFVRMRMMEMVADTASLVIVPPMALKTFACATTYGDAHIQSKSKKVMRNDEGIPGGSFKKREMLKAAYDTGGCDLADQIDDVKTVLMMANVPKPIDDLIDAWWLTRYAMERVTVDA